MATKDYTTNPYQSLIEIEKEILEYYDIINDSVFNNDLENLSAILHLEFLTKIESYIIELIKLDKTLFQSVKAKIANNITNNNTDLNLHDDDLVYLRINERLVDYSNKELPPIPSIVKIEDIKSIIRKRNKQKRDLLLVEDEHNLLTEIYLLLFSYLTDGTLDKNNELAIKILYVYPNVEKYFIDLYLRRHPSLSFNIHKVTSVNGKAYAYIYNFIYGKNRELYKNLLLSLCVVIGNENIIHEYANFIIEFDNYTCSDNIKDELLMTLSDALNIIHINKYKKRDLIYN